MEIDRHDPAFTLVCVLDVAAAKWAGQETAPFAESSDAGLEKEIV